MHHRLRGLLVALLPLLTAAGLIALPAGARAADPTDPPTVGQCHAMSYQQMMAMSDASQVVACSHSHTAYTFAVPTFPNGTDEATASTSTLIADADKACTKAAKPYFRGSDVVRDMALWSYAVFIPTDAQLAQNDNWIECDIDIVWPNKKLMPLPAIHKPVYSTKEPKVAAVCHQGRSQEYAMVPCTAGHQWRDVGGFNDKASKYPTRKQFLAAGQRCHAITKTKQFLVTWPQRKRWNEGDHAILCAKPSTR